MEAGFFKFDLGKFKCMSISDGGQNFPLDIMFNNVPLEQVKRVLTERGLPTDSLYTPFSLLFVDNGVQRILVDMGAGNFSPDAGKLRGNLIAAGVDPRSIDAVIITHAHPDHIGGTIVDMGSLAYPNADYYIWEKEWDFWWSENAAQQAQEGHAGLAQNALSAVKERVTLIKPGSEILPGVIGVDSAGHTPGHLAISIVSEGSELLLISDAALSPLHLENPHWHPALDIDPESSAKK